jgi:protein O-GlcNAc transferase
MHSNRPMLAVECLQQATAAHLDSVRYWSDLGTAWLAAGRAQDALAAISRAAQLQPGRADVLANLAQALLAAGRGNESFAALQQALTIAPADALVCYRAGIIHEQLRQPDEAKRFYNQALASQPNFFAARERLEALRSQ